MPRQTATVSTAAKTPKCMSQNAGKTEIPRTTLPHPYTARRPTLSERLPKSGMKIIMRKEAIINEVLCRSARLV